MFVRTVSKTLTTAIVSLKMTNDDCISNDYDRCMFCGEDMSNDYKS